MNTTIPDETNCVPLQPFEIQTLLADAPFQWWIAGGWALDLFLQRQTRPHFDIDVAIARQDQLAAQAFLNHWGFWSTRRDDCGEIVILPWEAGNFLDSEFPGVWARESATAPWRFEFLFHEIKHQTWTFRYADAVTHPSDRIQGLTADKIPYLLPEIALLYKAARRRDVDEGDFHRVLPHLNLEQRTQLAEDLRKFEPGHPWLEFLA